MGPKTIERVLARLKVEAVHRRGDRLWALCPFHKDRRATSWFIRLSGERAGQHHCFACKAGGALWELVKERLGYGTDDAAKEWLASFVADGGEDAPAPAVSGVSVRVAGGASGAFALPGGVTFEPLPEWPEPAREYLERRDKGGGVTAGQVERWGIGYALFGELAGRVVIPVWGPTLGGRRSVYGYMARAFDDREPRYFFPKLDRRPRLDAPFGVMHFPIFSKRRAGRVWVTEGALNALAVERALGGERDHVAAMGSSDVRPAHLGIFSTFGEVVIVTDPDPSGDAAAEEMRAGLGRHTLVTRVTIPEGEDAKSIPLEDLAKCLSTRS